ncbi:MAG: hypothetical protein KBC26_00905 [Candidatus Pacebacteria bacterium]|nr:hypothetical protein [Candidatus Paceibacterota bacterium]
MRSIGNNSSIDCHDDERRKLKRRFDVVMCRLKKDGMIKEDGHITKRGIIFLSSIIGRESKYLPTRSYQHGKSDTITLVTFDIPEKYKRYREWLRFVLRDMGFSMLQRSVWIGKVKIPKEFLTDLKNTKMIPFVEIVEISKLGSVERISNAG